MSPRVAGRFLLHSPVIGRGTDSSFSDRIVEFASQEDSQRAIRELSETPLLGRPVFIREVGKGFPVNKLSTHCVRGYRTEKQRPVSVLLPSLVR